jgi:predicted DNA-binding transcriptional regulator AlpA
VTRANPRRNPKRRVVGKSRPTPPRAEKSHHLDRRAARLIEPGNDDELLTTKALATWLAVSEVWVELGRALNYGPKFIRISERVIRYRRGDVNAWLKSRTRNCVAEYANG